MSVTSVDPHGDGIRFPTAEKKAIKLEKYSQEIELDSQKIVLVEGDKKKLKARA